MCKVIIHYKDGREKIVHEDECYILKELESVAFIEYEEDDELKLKKEEKLMKKLIIGLTIVLAILVTSLSYAVIDPGVYPNLKARIIAMFVQIDTSKINAEYVAMGDRISDYIRDIKKDAMCEINRYKDKKEKDEFEKIKIKEKEIKDSLLDAKNEAVKDILLQVDNKVLGDIESFDKALSVRLLKQVSE